MPSRTAKHPRTVSSWEDAQQEYAKTIRTFAYNSVSQLPGWDIADVEQELLIVLWRCVNKHDPTKGASFNTLFQGCARNQIITLIRGVNTQGRKGTNLTLEDDAVRYAAEEAQQYMSVEDIVMMNCELDLLYTPEEITRAISPDLRARALARKQGRLAS